MKRSLKHLQPPAAWRGAIPLLAAVLIPLVMCGGQNTGVVTSTQAPQARQGGMGGTGGGPGNGPSNVQWSTCTVGDCLIIEHVQSATLSAHGSVTVTATCPVDQRMLSGGYVIEHAAGDMFVTESYPSASGSWTVTALNYTDGDATLDADVNCVHVDMASAQTALPAPATATIAAGASATVAAACPAGLVPTGGGFRLAQSASASVGGSRFFAAARPAGALSGAFTVSIAISQPQADGWQVVASALNAAAASAYAVCWNAQHWSTISADFSAPAGGAGSAIAGFENCPTGTTLTGGGFRVADPAAYGALLVQSGGANNNDTVLDGWTVTASNTGIGAAYSVSALGVCAV